MTIAWWGYAVIASVIWGVHYVLIGRAMTVISPITLYWMPIIPLVIFLPFYYKTLIADAHALMVASSDVKISVSIVMFTSIIASVALYKAIQGNNPTIASLIEISFPIFVAIFAYLIFGDNHLNSWHAIAGGALIIAGTVLVIVGG